MTKSKKLFAREARRRNRDNDRDMGNFDMRPRDPYEILGIVDKAQAHHELVHRITLRLLKLMHRQMLCSEILEAITRGEVLGGTEVTVAVDRITNSIVVKIGDDEVRMVGSAKVVGED